MRSVARQDPSAQAELVEYLAARVLHVTHRLCPTRQDAEDAAQLALLEILRSAKNFRVETSLERWADRITARTALRMNQKERQRSQLIERWLIPGRFPWGTELHTAHKGVTGIGALLLRLPPKRRQAFVLRHALGYTMNEIADITGAPIGTVKDRLVHARKQLRRMLEVSA